MPPIAEFTKAGIAFAAGDDVLVAAVADGLPYIARIVAILKRSVDNGEAGYTLRINWYYRPEDIERKPYHGKQEVFKSDHIDTIHSATILSKCHVWDLEGYRGLPTITSLDFFSRYQWSTATKRFSPEQVPVYCSCEQPENPDKFMAECDKCLKWFHPECEDTSAAAVAQSGSFICQRCAKQHNIIFNNIDGVQLINAAPSLSNGNNNHSNGNNGFGSLFPGLR